MTPLPKIFLRVPISHRALHDLAAGRPENSLSAMRAAIDRGYGIELDVQSASDGTPMVFHDYKLGRLTGEKGLVNQRTPAELEQIPLAGSTHGDTIPSLAQVLDLVAGRVPLLIEIKDQDGALGPDTGALEAATAKELAGYDGPVAVMSFNPHSVAEFNKLAPHVPVGLTTGRFSAKNWPIVSKNRLSRLADIHDFEDSGASFISHRADALSSPAVTRLKAEGVPILCWTTRTPAADAKARKIADNVTFERYLPAIPAE